MLSGQSHQCKVKLQAENERNVTEEMILVHNFLNSHYEKHCARCTLEIQNINKFNQQPFQGSSQTINIANHLFYHNSNLFLLSLWKRYMLLMSPHSAQLLVPSICLRCSNLAKKEIKSEAKRHQKDGLKPAMT